MDSSSRERIYGFIRERILAGASPSIREVQEYIGFKNVKSAQEQVERLIRDGRLVRVPGIARGLRLPGNVRANGRAGRASGRAPTIKETAEPLRLVPVLGRVHAGPFDLATEDVEGQVAVRGGGELFGLRVRGESMRDAGILDGDLVLVCRQPNADAGQVVVALIDDEATVKTLRYRGRRPELHPANPAFPVLRPSPEELRILGRVIEVRRELDS